MGIMSLAEIMDNSIDVLRKYIKTIIMFNIGYSIISFIMVFVAVFLWLILTLISVQSGQASLFVILPFLLASIFGVVLSSHVGMIKITNQEFAGGEVYAFDAIKASFKSIFKIFRVVLAAFVLFIPGAVILGSVIYAFIKSYSYSYLTSSGGAQPISIIIFTVFLILLAGFTILSYITTLIFSVQAMVIEEKGVVDSIKRSFKLVSNDFWKLFGAVFLFLLTLQAIGYSLEAFIGLVVNIMYFISKLLNLSQDYLTFVAMMFSKLNWATTIITYLIISPLAGTMITFLYYNQRFKKEGYDISLRLKSIKTQTVGLVREEGGNDNSFKD